MRDNPGPNRDALTFTQLKDERLRNVVLLDLGLADVKLPRLTVMVGEGFRADTKFWSAVFAGIRLEAPLRRLARTAALPIP